MVLILIPSLKPQEGDGISLLAWIDLELGFQIWVFLQKIQICFLVYGAASSSWARGLALVCIGEWFRLRTWSKIHALMWKNIWFANHNFPNLFHAFWLQSHPITFDSFLSWFARNIEHISCIKRLKNLGLAFFICFN